MNAQSVIVVDTVLIEALRRKFEIIAKQAFYLFSDQHWTTM